MEAAIRDYIGKSSTVSTSSHKKTDKRKKKVKRKHKNKESEKGADTNVKNQPDNQSSWQRLLSSAIDWLISNATIPNASQISVICMFMLVLINLFIASKMAQMDRQLEAIHQGVDSKKTWEPEASSHTNHDNRNEIENELWDWLGQLDPDHQAKTAIMEDPSSGWDKMTEDDNASWDAQLRESQIAKDKLDQHMADLEKMIQRASNNMQEVTKVVERQRSRILENWSS